jgi:hypothetical protein
MASTHVNLQKQAQKKKEKYIRYQKTDLAIGSINLTAQTGLMTRKCAKAKKKKLAAKPS